MPPQILRDLLEATQAAVRTTRTSIWVWGSCSVFQMFCLLNTLRSFESEDKHVLLTVFFGVVSGRFFQKGSDSITYTSGAEVLGPTMEVQGGTYRRANLFLSCLVAFGACFHFASHLACVLLFMQSFFTGMAVIAMTNRVRLKRVLLVVIEHLKVALDQVVSPPAGDPTGPCHT
jgi:hypothetical protein